MRMIHINNIARTSITIIFLLLFSIQGSSQESFRDKQKSYSRVKEAYESKLSGLENKLKTLGIDPDDMDIFIIGYKKDKDLEVWAKNKGNSQFIKVLDYKFCMLSGKPGPKRQQGDLQVPEGYYNINVYNPWSNFHLSIGINYPNPSDRILGVRNKLGGDIYIHGSCVSIGCIPITNRNIKELYVICVEAKNGGQEHIPVHLYPARLEKGVMTDLIKNYNPDTATINLWKDLQLSYNYFLSYRKIPNIQFLNSGRHKIK